MRTEKRKPPVAKAGRLHGFTGANASGRRGHLGSPVGLGPLAVTVQEIATVNNAENVRALERQIEALMDVMPGEGAHTIPVPLSRRLSR